MHTKNDDMVSFIKQLENIAKEGNLDKLLVVGKLKDDTDGGIITGCVNTTVTDKQELIGHLQIDVITDVIDMRYL